MNIVCGKQQLLQAVITAERVTAKKESLPILSCILLDIENKILSVRATNLEVAVDIKVPAQVSEGGRVGIPASLLTQTLRAVQGDQITLVIQDKTAVVKAKNSTTTLHTVPTDEFPPIPRSENNDQITIPRNVLIEGIQSVVYAASQSTIRPEFASILCRSEGGHLFFVATDSFRLAEKKISIDHKNFPDLLIPTRNALELVYVLEQSEENQVEMTMDDGQLSVQIGSTSFVTRITDASFPNYQPILPKEFTTTVTVLKADAVATIKKARLFSHTNQQLSFHVYPEKKTFSVTAQHVDVGDMVELLDGVLEGGDLDINFNISYLQDCFSSINSDSVVFSFAGAGRPLVITGVGEPTFMYLVMPLNK